MHIGRAGLEVRKNGGQVIGPERFNKTALNENDGLEPVPDIEGGRGTFNILGWALGPGDAVAFNDLTLHGAMMDAPEFPLLAG